jgi:GNAT superfamily N-acetyltransferase
MSFRPMEPADFPKVLGFLAQHEATSMFPLTNLMGRGPATESWVIGAGEITGYLGLTSTGVLMPQAPGVDWHLARGPLAGREVTGLTGAPEQAQALQAALGLDAAEMRMNQIEPGFSLDLADLILPDCEGLRLAPIFPDDLSFAVPWRAGSLVETMGFPPEIAPQAARHQMIAYQAAGRHRILWRGAEPLAMAGVNASIPEVVQVGAVYTPPELRGQGYARRAVALLLDEARHNGIKRALLFTASDHAARAYRAIGFAQSHGFALIMLASPQRIAA